MLEKVKQREATILEKHVHIKNASKPIVMPEKPKKPYIRKVYDYKWLPKQTHDYIDR